MKNNLKYFGGSGFEGLKENGKYEVKCKITKQFSKLSEAKKYYESLNEEKAFWDITNMPELIEAFVKS
jgi:hypothetical protein